MVVMAEGWHTSRFSQARVGGAACVQAQRAARWADGRITSFVPGPARQAVSGQVLGFADARPATINAPGTIGITTQKVDELAQQAEPDASPARTLEDTEDASDLREFGRARVIGAFMITSLLLGVCWGVELINDDRTLSARYGLHPRQTAGLWQIFTSPFLHWDREHIISNSVGLAILGFLGALRGISRFIVASLIIIVVSGLGVWYLSGPGATTGASGLVYGYYGYYAYLSVRDFAERRSSFGEMIIPLSFGPAMIYGVLPQPGISWQGHLFGLLGGIIAGWPAHRRGTAISPHQLGAAQVPVSPNSSPSGEHGPGAGGGGGTATREGPAEATADAIGRNAATGPTDGFHYALGSEKPAPSQHEHASAAQTPIVTAHPDVVWQAPSYSQGNACVSVTVVKLPNPGLWNLGLSTTVEGPSGYCGTQELVDH